MSVVGARPNFMKIAPFIRAINNHNLNRSEAIRQTTDDGRLTTDDGRRAPVILLEVNIEENINNLNPKEKVLLPFDIGVKLLTSFKENLLSITKMVTFLLSLSELLKNQ
jgi:hypothetical protein